MYVLSRLQQLFDCLLQFLLHEWAKELNARPLPEKRSYQGKLASATFKQTEAYLKPLFKSLRKRVSLQACIDT